MEAEPDPSLDVDLEAPWLDAHLHGPRDDGDHGGLRLHYVDSRRVRCINGGWLRDRPLASNDDEETKANTESGSGKTKGG
ncbi:MAG: hypothetical protein P1V81_14630 [Planctomycetota bacterium]|nr:hypothetical protein [Planctomycetota bacterium]